MYSLSVSYIQACLNATVSALCLVTTIDSGCLRILSVSLLLDVGQPQSILNRHWYINHYKIYSIYKDVAKNTSTPHLTEIFYI